MPKVMTCEKDVKEGVKKLFKKYDVWYFMPSMNGYGRSGVPDFVACHRGRFLAVETKFDNRKPTILQWREMDGIRRANGIAMVVNEHALEYLEGVLRDMDSQGDINP